MHPGPERALSALALAVLLLAAAEVRAAPVLEPEGRVVWREQVEGFGGFSGLAVVDGGAGLVAIGDRGVWATAAMQRDAAGRMTGVTMTGFGPLLGVEGAPLTGEDSDAEALAIDALGRIFVAFEGFHRVRRYDRIEIAPKAVRGHRDFPRLQRNSGLEALAIDAEGTLYAIPERSGAWERPFPVYRLRHGDWDRRLSLPRTGTFLVADAAFGPDGRFYLLERDFTWVRGFATRVRRFTLSPSGFDAGETLLETSFGELDNMEGISVWRNAEGETRLTLISDDNFFPLQRTLIVEYRVTDD